MPNGPALAGPMRFCMPAMALRSNQTINIVATRPMTKTTTHLGEHDEHVAEVEVADEQRIEAEHQRFSIRTSVTAAWQSISSPTVPPGWLNGIHTVPRSTVGSGCDA